MEEIELQNQIAILKNERQPYLNTRFLLERRMKMAVNLLEKGIFKADDDPKKPIMEELVKVQAIIEEWDNQIKELEAQLNEEPQIPVKKNGHLSVVKEQA